MNENTMKFLPPLGENVVPVVGFIGNGWGQALETVVDFSPHYKKVVAGEEFKVTLDELVEAQPHITFVDFGMKENTQDRLDVKETIDAVLKLLRHTRSGIVIRSLLFPEHILSLLNTVAYQDDMERIIYEPPCSNADVRIFGGTQDSCKTLSMLYETATHIQSPQRVVVVNPFEASLLDVSLSAFRYMRGLLVNQTKQLSEKEPNLYSNILLYKTLVSLLEKEYDFGNRLNWKTDISNRDTVEFFAKHTNDIGIISALIQQQENDNGCNGQTEEEQQD